MPAHTVPDPADYRFRRIAVAVAAATAVVLGPTACDIGLSTGAADPQPASGGGYSSGQGGHSGHGTDGYGTGGYGATPAGQVGEATYEPVPVNAVEELDPTDDGSTGSGGSTDGDGGAGTPAGDAPGGDAPEGDAPEGGAPEGDAPADPDATDVPAPSPAGPTPSASASPAPTSPGATPAPSASPAPTGSAGPTPAPTPPPALQTLGGDCTGSGLAPHDGFQNAPRCVSIAFGEVAGEDRSPSLLITEAPTEVGTDEAFTLQVSTRNLVRDRFLGAAAGGYYRESSFLNGQGIQRGHFHTACRLLSDLTLAPDAQPAPAFFLATQDNGGGREADQVRVPVPGLKAPGTYQCAVWAGDGSHRVPMMQRANQTPAFDAVRITVG